MDVDVANDYDNQLHCGNSSSWNRSTIGVIVDVC
jgi:hypothetical protein